jgi:hypothetical protein
MCNTTAALKPITRNKFQNFLKGGLGAGIGALHFEGNHGDIQQ